MKYRSLFALFLSSLSLDAISHDSFGHTSADRPIMTRRPTAYIGLMGGWELLGGFRSERIKNTAGIPVEFTQAKGMKQNNINAYGYGGMSFRPVHSSQITIAPEIYVGQGYTEATFRQTVADPTTGDNKNFSASFRRTFSWGVLVKIGADFWRDYNFYLLAGFDRSRYQYQLDYSFDRLRVGLPPNPFVTSTQWLWGTIFGLGLEKRFKRFRVALESRLITPRSFRVAQNIADGERFEGYVKPLFFSTFVKISYHY